MFHSIQFCIYFLATLLFLYSALWAHFAFTRVPLRYITLHYNTRVLRWNTVEVRILIRVADTQLCTFCCLLYTLGRRVCSVMIGSGCYCVDNLMREADSFLLLFLTLRTVGYCSLLNVTRILHKIWTLSVSLISILL